MKKKKKTIRIISKVRNILKISHAITKSEI